MDGLRLVCGECDALLCRVAAVIFVTLLGLSCDRRTVNGFQVELALAPASKNAYCLEYTCLTSSS